MGSRLQRDHSAIRSRCSRGAAPFPTPPPNSRSCLMSSDRELLVLNLGALPYAESLELQRAVARARIAGTITQDVLLLVEHPPVVTLGRSSKTQHLTASPAHLAARGVVLFEVERG